MSVPITAAELELKAKEKATQERLEKRAVVAAASLRKFVANFMTLVEQERLAKEAAKNKPKAKKKKKKDEAEPAAKAANKPKGPKRTAAQQAWFAMFADLDERIFKAKRLALEDLYRGVALLAPVERVNLVAIVVSTPAKALRPTLLNPNQISIKAALAAATHANDLERDRVVFTPAMGVMGMHNRGCSTERLLSTGFKEGELLRAGLPAEQVIAACDDLARLQAAGLAAHDVLDVPHVPRSYEHLSEAAQLRRAGYSASDVLSAGVRGVVQLRDAGFSVEELTEARLSADALTAGAVGHPDLPPLSAWVQRTQPLLQELTPDHVPRLLDGTQSPKWRDNRLLQGYRAAPASPNRRFAPQVQVSGRSEGLGGASGTPSGRPRTGAGGTPRLASSTFGSLQRDNTSDTGGLPALGPPRQSTPTAAGTSGT